MTLFSKLGIVFVSLWLNIFVPAIELNNQEKEDIKNVLIEYMQNNQGKGSTNYSRYETNYSEEIINNHILFKTEIEANKGTMKKFKNSNLEKSLKAFKLDNDSFEMMPSFLHKSSDDDRYYQLRVLTYYFSRGFHNYYTITVANGKKNYIDLNQYNNIRNFLVYKDKKKGFKVVAELVQWMN